MKAVWTASDLARQRTSILHEAQRDVAFVRASDGTLLAFLKATVLEELDSRAEAVQLLAAAVSAVSDPPVRSAALGDLAFLIDWPTARRLQFAVDLADVVTHAAAVGDPSEVTRFILASRPRRPQGVIHPDRVRAAVASSS